MKSARGFAPILIVLIILGSIVVGAGGLFAYQKYSKKAPVETKQKSEIPYTSPSPKSTYSPVPMNQPLTDWKTFASPRLKLSIKHPNDWSPDETTEKVVDSDSEIKNDLVLTNKNGSSIEITDWIAAMGPFTPEDKVTVETIGIGGEKLHINYIEGFPNNRLIIGQIKNNDKELFVFINFKSENPQIKSADWEVIKQILKTVTFTK